MLSVLSLAIVSLGERYGKTMLIRVTHHVCQYGDLSVRRAVPLCLALIYVSNPEMLVTDFLSKLSHDNDLETVNGAILSLGIVSAGTNNSCVSGMLRQLMQYHQKNADQLFLVRLALGLVHMGKGLITLSPIHSNGILISKRGVSGLLTLLVSCLDLKNNILGTRHYILYCLSVAIRPRMLTILDENLISKKVGVRVGMEVDIVGIVGKHKSITAFQTYRTPVILGAKQKAELSTPSKWISHSPIFEGFVIVKENPNYDKE